MAFSFSLGLMRVLSLPQLLYSRGAGRATLPHQNDAIEDVNYPIVSFNVRR